MPRPTAAQLAYGSCTVIFSTLAMLLLSQTSSGLGIAGDHPLGTRSRTARRRNGSAAEARALRLPGRRCPAPAPPVQERVPAQRETASVSASLSSAVSSASVSAVREPAGP